MTDFDTRMIMKFKLMKVKFWKGCKKIIKVRIVNPKSISF